MSLISDALRKAEAQRSNPELKHVSSWDRRTRAEVMELQSPSEPKSSRTLMFANIAVLALLCVVAVYFFRDQPMGAATETLSTAGETQSDSGSILSPAPSSASSTSLQPQSQGLTTSANVSPFLPPAVAPAEQPPATEEYSLVGTSTLGSSTLISVVRLSDRRSIWIPVGKTVGEVTAVSYDAGTDQAVIRVRGNLLTIKLDVLPPATAEAEPAPEAEAEAANAPP